MLAKATTGATKNIGRTSRQTFFATRAGSTRLPNANNMPVAQIDRPDYQAQPDRLKGGPAADFHADGGRHRRVHDEQQQSPAGQAKSMTVSSKNRAKTPTSAAVAPMMLDEWRRFTSSRPCGL